MSNNSLPTSYVRIPEQKLKEYVALENEVIRLRQENARLTSHVQALLAMRSEQPTLVESITSSNSNQILESASAPRNELPAPSLPTQAPNGPNGPVRSPRSTPPAESLRTTLDAFAPAISDPLTLPNERVVPKGALTLETPRRTAVPYWEIYKGTIDYIKSLSNPSNHALPIPYLLDERSIMVIMQGIEMGMSRSGAAALVGITRSILDRYRANSNREIEPYVTFFALMEMAEARTEADLIAKWQAHTRDSWQATEALMKRRFQATWGDKSNQTDLASEQLAGLSIEELARIANIDPAQIVLTATQDEDGSYGTQDAE